MKKSIMLIVTLILCMSMLAGCGGGTAPEVVPTITSGEIVSQMVEQGFVRMPMEIDEVGAQERYRIDLGFVEDYAIAETGISPGPGLIVVAKAKPDQVQNVVANMEKLLEDKVGNAFYPDEVEAAQQAEVIVNGPYVGLLILNGEVKDDGIKMFNDLTK